MVFIFHIRKLRLLKIPFCRYGKAYVHDRVIGIGGGARLQLGIPLGQVELNGPIRSIKLNLKQFH